MNGPAHQVVAGFATVVFLAEQERQAGHGLCDLTLQAKGDLHIDVHHTVEDVALALGQAFDQALGDRKGLVRMGDCFVPMDETLAHVAVDLSALCSDPGGVAHAICR